MSLGAIAWSADESAYQLLDDALRAFDAAALARIEELALSPTSTAPSLSGLDDDSASVVGSAPGATGVGEGVAQPATHSSGFSFALRSLAAVAPYASDGVAAELMRWHDREQARALSASYAGAEADRDRAVRECAVDCVFCEAMLAALGASRCRDSILLDSLQESALDFFRLPSATRQHAARRRLEALGGRSEEMLWIDLRRGASAPSERLAARRASVATDRDQYST